MAKTILLADDSITIQKVVELTFSDGDYNVVAVSNGARAIERLAELQPDIILSDIIMPEKNGYEVCEYVKSHPEYRHIPVVLLTGTFEPFDPERAEKAGCDAVVTKPFESQSLIHKVEELIANSVGAAPGEPAESPATDSEAELQETAPPEPPAATPFGGWGEIPADPEISGEAQVWRDHTEPSWERSPTTEAPLDAQPPYSDEASQPFGGSAETGIPEQEEPPAFGGFGSGAAAEESPAFGEFGSGAAAEEPPAFAGFDSVSPSEEPAPSSGGFDSGPVSFGESTSAFTPEPGAFSEHEPSSFSGQSDDASPFESEQAFDSGATQAFPKMSLEDFQRMQGDPLSEEVPPSQPEPEQAASSAFEPASSPDATPAPSPWDEAPAWNAPEPEQEERSVAGESPALSEPSDDDGSTRMIPIPSMDELRRMQAEDAAETGQESESEDRPTGQLVSFASPFGNREEIDSPSPADAGASPFEEEAPSSEERTEPSEDAFAERDFEAAPAETESPEAPFGEAEAPFSPSQDEAASPFEAESAWSGSAETEGEQEQAAPSFGESPAWAPAPAAFSDEQAGSLPPPAPSSDAPADTSWAAAQPSSVSSDQPMVASGAAGIEGTTAATLSDEQIEKIARRVVELLSEEVIRKIAWEVIPDMAETVVRERIQELEAEA